jgi:hypothetical protein
MLKLSSSGTLPPDVKEEWVTALRSNKYPKGKGTLKTKRAYGTTFCCLGVLCEIRELESIPNISDTTLFSYKGDEGHNFLPDSFANELHIGSNPYFVIHTAMSVRIHLSDLNDYSSPLGLKDFTFPMIADIIDYFF